MHRRWVAALPISAQVPRDSPGRDRRCLCPRHIFPAMLRIPAWRCSAWEFTLRWHSVWSGSAYRYASVAVAIITLVPARTKLGSVALHRFVKSPSASQGACGHRNLARTPPTHLALPGFQFPCLLLGIHLRSLLPQRLGMCRRLTSLSSRTSRNEDDRSIPTWRPTPRTASILKTIVTSSKRRREEVEGRQRFNIH